MAHTTQTGLLTTTVNELVQKSPESLPVLNDFGIDTCCGGGSLLRDAALEAGVDPDQVARALERLAAE